MTKNYRSKKRNYQQKKSLRGGRSVSLMRSDNQNGGFVRSGIRKIKKVNKKSKRKSLRGGFVRGGSRLLSNQFIQSGGGGSHKHNDSYNHKPNRMKSKKSKRLKRLRGGCACSGAKLV